MAPVWDSVLDNHSSMLNDYSPWGCCLTQTCRDSLDLLCAIPQLGNEDTKRIANTLGSWCLKLKTHQQTSGWAGGSVQIWAIQGGRSSPRGPLSCWHGLIRTEKGSGITHTLDLPSVLRCFYVGCIYIYSCFIFFLDWSLGHYAVSFLVSYNNLILKSILS